VGGFFRFRHRTKFTSARLAEMKKAKRCGAADGFLFLLSWVQGVPVKGSFAVRRKIPDVNRPFSLKKLILTKSF